MLNFKKELHTVFWMSFFGQGKKEDLKICLNRNVSNFLNPEQLETNNQKNEINNN